eukprot:3277606-Pyramimonas_sp.AAC.1
MIVIISHNDIAAPVHSCYITGVIELSGSALSILMTLHASAGQCGHQALRRDLADAMVVRISHDDIAVPVHCHSAGAVRSSTGGAGSISMALLASARNRGHQALRRDLADTMVFTVGHYYIAGPVHRHATGLVELNVSVVSVCSIALLAGAR